MGNGRHGDGGNGDDGGGDCTVINSLSYTQGHNTHAAVVAVVVIHARTILFYSKIKFSGRNKSRSIDQSNDCERFASFNGFATYSTNAVLSFSSVRAHARCSAATAECEISKIE